MLISRARSHAFRPLGLVLAAALSLSACVSTDLPPIGASGHFTPEDDERRLWLAAREAEQRVLPEKLVYDDAALEAYLAEIVRRLTPASYTAAGGTPIQVKIRKDPRLNAAAMPHGLIVIHTGLIARAESEGQLAGVLGHEIAHITHRHTVRERRHIQNRQTAINVAALLGSLALAAAAVDQSTRGNYGTAHALSSAGQPLLALGLNLTYSAMVSGYSRDLEREADEEAVRMLAAAGYSPADMVAMFRQMLEESPDGGSIETFFWGSHPRLTERIESIEREASKYPANRGTADHLFEHRTARVRLANAGFDAYFGRRQLAMTQVRRALALVPADRRQISQILWEGHIDGWVSVGARSRKDHARADESLRAAVGQYNRVLASPDPRARAAAYRGIADLHFAHRGHDTAFDCQAKAAYSKYLDIYPAAPDRGSITSRMADLRCR